VCIRCFCVQCNDHVLDQGAQQLFAIAVGGRRRIPHTCEIGAEGQDRGAFRGAERPRALLLPTRQLALRSGELVQTRVPLGLEPAGNEAVLGVDRPISSFRALRFVAGAFDLSPSLGEGCVMIRFELFGGA
jgi:hypothetical protein